MSTIPPTRTQAERSDHTRARILEAAITHFSEKGLAGARTDQIAETAGVNKALLYYYFESKDKLYTTALETLANQVRDSQLQVFRSESSPGEKLLRSALAHFDRILAQRPFQSMIQQEMIRLHRQGEPGSLPMIVERVFAPGLAMIQTLVRDGVMMGELIDVDWMQLQLASIGANVFYFINAPIWRMTTHAEPLDAATVAHRRKLMVEFLGQAIFIDRGHGAEVAARILATTPMPEFSCQDPFRGVRHERTQ